MGVGLSRSMFSWAEVRPAEDYRPMLPIINSPTDCGLCWGPVVDAAFTNTQPCCKHFYCRQCLVSWSKLYNVCPDCRRVYTKILFNVRGRLDYDWQLVPQPNRDDQQLVVENVSNLYSDGLLFTAEPRLIRWFFMADNRRAVLKTPTNSGMYVVDLRHSPPKMVFFEPNTTHLLRNFTTDMCLVHPELIGGFKSDLATTTLTEPTAPEGRPVIKMKSAKENECPICCGPIVDIAYTDTCQHWFCRVCISFWSDRGHANCPVCRSSISAIIFNVRSPRDYDQRLVGDQPVTDPLALRVHTVEPAMEWLNHPDKAVDLGEDVGFWYFLNLGRTALFKTPATVRMSLINGHPTGGGVRLKTGDLKPDTTYKLTHCCAITSVIRRREKKRFRVGRPEDQDRQWGEG